MSSELHRVGQADVSNAEIEATPLMIEAGLDALWDHDLERDGGRVVVLTVYAAMQRAKLVELAKDVGDGSRPRA